MGGGGSSKTYTYGPGQDYLAQTQADMARALWGQYENYAPNTLYDIANYVDDVNSGAYEQRLYNDMVTTARDQARQSGANEREATSRQLLGMGVNPNDARFAGALRQQEFANTSRDVAQVGNAAIQARQQADNLGWARSNDFYKMLSGMQSDSVSALNSASNSLNSANTAQSQQNAQNNAAASGYGQFGAAIGSQIKYADGGPVRGLRMATGGMVPVAGNAPHQLGAVRWGDVSAQRQRGLSSRDALAQAALPALAILAARSAPDIAKWVGEQYNRAPVTSATPVPTAGAQRGASGAEALPVDMPLPPYVEPIPASAPETDQLLSEILLNKATIPSINYARGGRVYGLRPKRFAVGGMASVSGGRPEGGGIGWSNWSPPSPIEQRTPSALGQTVAGLAPSVLSAATKAMTPAADAGQAGGQLVGNGLSATGNQLGTFAAEQLGEQAATTATTTAAETAAAEAAAAAGETAATTAATTAAEAAALEAAATATAAGAGGAGAGAAAGATAGTAVGPVGTLAGAAIGALASYLASNGGFAQGGQVRGLRMPRLPRMPKIPKLTIPKNLQRGGDVQGPGTETSDSIPARLSDGEYVLNADAVEMIGVKALDALNQMGLRKRRYGG